MVHGLDAGHRGTQESRREFGERFGVTGSLEHPGCGRCVMRTQQVFLGEHPKHFLGGFLGARNQRDVLAQRQLNQPGQQRIVRAAQHQRVDLRALQRLEIPLGQSEDLTPAGHAPLDEVEARLGRQRYLVGNQITEADWRLFPTLARFDVAYFSLFKCNRNRIADYPNLLNYVRELYAVPGVAETVKPRYYVMGYYSITRVNPTGIIPKGTPVDFRKPHDRARFAA